MPSAVFNLLLIDVSAPLHHGTLALVQPSAVVSTTCVASSFHSPHTPTTRTPMDYTNTPTHRGPPPRAHLRSVANPSASLFPTDHIQPPSLSPQRHFSHQSSTHLHLLQPPHHQHISQYSMYTGSPSPASTSAIDSDMYPPAFSTTHRSPVSTTDNDIVSTI